MPTLARGEIVEVVIRQKYKVLGETTGIISVPTFEVWDDRIEKHKVVWHDPELGWQVIHGKMAEEYYRKTSPKEVSRQVEARDLTIRKNFIRYKNPYVRHGKYPIEQILPLLKNGCRDKQYIELDGVQVKITSQRYEVFRQSTKCYVCGIEGSFFASEKMKANDSDRYHFNLYAIDKDGNEVILTRDHIIPKAKKGSLKLHNQKTCCYICNMAKSDALV